MFKIGLQRASGNNIKRSKKARKHWTFCDAEQIIYCEKDKTTNHIFYESGAIENPIMRDHVVDVLEGTMPAFDLRRLKYAPSTQ